MSSPMNDISPVSGQTKWQKELLCRRRTLFSETMSSQRQPLIMAITHNDLWKQNYLCETATGSVEATPDNPSEISGNNFQQKRGND